MRTVVGVERLAATLEEIQRSFEPVVRVIGALSRQTEVFHRLAAPIEEEN